MAILRLVDLKLDITNVPNVLDYFMSLLHIAWIHFNAW
jgi:hypothetical protein